MAESSGCPTCGCTLYSESGPCVGKDLLEALKAMHDAFWGTSHNAVEDAANAKAITAIAKVDAR